MCIVSRKHDKWIKVCVINVSKFYATNSNIIIIILKTIRQPGGPLVYVQYYSCRLFSNVLLSWKPFTINLDKI